VSKLPINVIRRIAVLFLVIGIVIFLLTRHVDIAVLLETGGIVAIAATIFAETGLLIGFFLPGDTRLFAAGFFAAQGKISLIGSIVAVFLGSVFGNMVGYEIGKRSGPKIFKKEDALLLTPQTIEKANLFYQNHGGKTILLARFIPIVRTLAPLIAGIGKMNYKAFMFYNLIGALLWSVSITMVVFMGLSISNDKLHPKLPVVDSSSLINLEKMVIAKSVAFEKVLVENANSTKNN
jgi:membrane-associated protein